MNSVFLLTEYYHIVMMWKCTSRKVVQSRVTRWTGGLLESTVIIIYFRLTFLGFAKAVPFSCQYLDF